MEWRKSDVEDYGECENFDIHFCNNYKFNKFDTIVNKDKTKKGVKEESEIEDADFEVVD